MTTSEARRRLRWDASAVAVMTVVAMALSLLLAPPSRATHEAPAARGVDEACPPGQVADPFFDDVAGNPHESAIGCIAAWEITKGRTLTAYGPAIPTRRDQMASFIARMLDTAGVDVPRDAPQAYEDVPPGNGHFWAVNALAQMGVVAGQTADSYQPARSVRRDQMASFISRAAEQVLGAALTDDHEWFVDVDESNVHFAAVNGLAAAGIVQGRDAEARVYGPHLNARRDAMASFVGRMLDLLAAEGVIDPPPPARVARAMVTGTDGAQLGEVVFAEQEEDRVEVRARLEGLPPGFHGFHVHAAGACEPDFTAAGGHYNPEGQPHGEHAGDLPVLLVGDDGTAVARFTTDRVSVEGLLTGEGTAVILHADADNYANIPARYVPEGPDEDTLATGDAGARIACGVLQASNELPPVATPPVPDAQATMRSTAGAELGHVTFAEQSNGVVEVRAWLEGLPPGGFHGFHVHAAGACEPDFTAAGGHHDPEGQLHGEHAGDLPVLLVGDDGTAETYFVTDRISIEGLAAGEGTAVIIHADADNYANIPARYAPEGPDEATLATGDAGARIACGVVQLAPQP